MAGYLLKASFHAFSVSKTHKTPYEPYLIIVLNESEQNQCAVYEHRQ